MPDVEKLNMDIPSQGQTRPGGSFLSADQVREVLTFNQRVLTNTTGATLAKFKEPAIDPLVVINEAVAKANHDVKTARWKQTLGLGLSIPIVPLVAEVLRFAGILIEPPVEMLTYPLVDGVILFDAYRYPKKRRGRLHEETAEALKILELVGIREDAIKKTFPTKRLVSEEWEEWFVARDVRATKLYLATRGRLQEYEEGKWLQTVPIPEWLKPTKVELAEVHEHIEKDRKELDEFARSLMQQEIIIIECGNELLAETNNIFLFPNPKNHREYSKRPLIDVVRGLAGTANQIKDVGFKNGIALLTGNNYEGLHSPKGRQRIADFFGKPVRVFTGGEVTRTHVNKYGVKEPDVFIDGGLEMYLQLGFNRNPMLHHEDAIPTKTRLKKIGLVAS